MPDPTPSPSAPLYKYLRAWRKSRKLTLARLAEAIGSKVSTIQGWETGARHVDLEDLGRLANHYGVHPAALLFAPDDAAGKVSRMQRASTIAERIEAEAAEEWLRLGQRLASDTSSD